MASFKLDFNKLFELQVLLIEADQDLLHLFKQMLLSLGIKKIDTARQVDELLSRETPVQADIVFLDYAVDAQLTGGEIIDQLVRFGVLPNRTRLVLMTQQNEKAQYSLEYPYHQISYLERPFNKLQLDQELKQQVMFSPMLRPLLTLAGRGRYADCLKLLLHTQSQPLPPGIDAVLQRLRVQLLLDLQKFDAIVPLLRQPVAEQQGWALWALYRIRYERGDLAACQAFLTDSSEELAHYTERRALWLIYLAMQEHDYARAYQVAQTIPNVGMSSNMVRLVHLTAILADDIDKAQEFIERKRRLAARGELYLQLSVSQARALLWRLEHSEAPYDSQMLQQLELLLSQISADKSTTELEVSLALLQAHTTLFASNEQLAVDIFRHRLAQTDWQELPVSVLCHAIEVCHFLHQHNLLQDLLFYADCQLQQMADNCHRLFAACLYQHAFDLVVPLSQYSQQHQQLAARYLQQQQILPAARQLRRALRHDTQNLALRQQLYQLMQQMGIQRFRGINLPSEQPG